MSIPSVIGEGAYGCVHKPSLTCSNKNISYKNKISKIMLSKEAAKELQEYTIISTVDKNNEYYLGLPIKCKVKTNYKSIKAVNKCKNIKRKYLKNKTTKHGLDKMALIVMNDGGFDLKLLSKKYEKMQNNKEGIRKIKKFWLETHRLFRGVFTLQKHGIAHHDLKPQNIVYNINTNRINFIDFGHMRNINREMAKCIKSDNWIYDYAFWNYPFEIQFLNKDEYMNFAYKTKGQKERFILDFIKDLHQDNDTKFVNAFRIFMDYILKNKDVYTEKNISDRYLLEFRKLCMDQILKNEYNTFLEKSIRSVDVYGLGMSLQFMLAHVKKFMDSDTVRNMEMCFFNMTTPNLLQRYTIDEAIDKFETILYDAKYLEDFGIQFENHIPVKTHVGSMNKTEKVLRHISSDSISLRNMDKERIAEAMNRSA